MRYLIDTQILIWALEDSPRLSVNAKKMLTNGDNFIFISVASLWEMAIKINLGKLELSQPLSEIIRRLPELEIDVLTIHPNHVLEVEKLLLYHRDPFDRIIIAQAIGENMEIISSDEQFPQYPVNVNW
jgi:PIN domain nuclease of toxin-antitoxin system